MLKSVLESISEMLGKGIEPGKVTNIAYIECAKTLLDKTISGMENKDEPAPTYSAKELKAALGQKKADVQYAVLAPNGKLERIEYPDGRELEGDAMISLDGVAMEYRAAIGKAFQTGAVL